MAGGGAGTAREMRAKAAARLGGEGAGGLAFLGLSVSRVWTYAFFITLLQPLSLPVPDALSGVPMGSVLFFLAGAAVAFGVAAAAPRVDARFARSSAGLAGACGTAAAVCVLACDALGGAPLALAAALLGGSALALMRLAWGQLYGAARQDDAGIYTATSFLLATLANVVLKLLPWGLTAAALLALPSVCALLVKKAGGSAWDSPAENPLPPGARAGRGGLARRAGGSAPPGASSQGGGRGFSWPAAQLALGMFVFVFANSLVRSFIPESGAWAAGWGSVAVDGAVALLFVGLYVVVRGMDPLPAYRCTLILMVAGYTLCTLVPERTQAVAMSLVLVGYGLFDLLSWVAMTRAAAQAGTGALGPFALGIGATLAGRALGYLVGGVCARLSEAGALSLQSLSLLMVLLLVVVCVSVLPESAFSRFSAASGEPGEAVRGDGHVEEGAPGAGGLSAAGVAGRGGRGSASLEEACERIARERGLTAREADILPLLARGHSAQVVAAERSISKGTVQTHIKHIYAKLGLHNQQELIELVERAMGRGGA